ncbi:hypothetical protein BHM03_00041014 [Ensete ventricosum]|nr:hypothetical protein BHM03_00041014 [Ensete ventricosum]
MPSWRPLRHVWRTNYPPFLLNSVWVDHRAQGDLNKAKVHIAERTPRRKENQDKLRALFAEFNLSRPPSPRRSQQGESSYRREDSQEKGEPTTDTPYPRMRVDFPRWEEGNTTGWISHAKRYFRYHKTPDASMVDITAIHLEGNVIQ